MIPVGSWRVSVSYQLSQRPNDLEPTISVELAAVGANANADELPQLFSMVVQALNRFEAHNYSETQSRILYGQAFGSPLVAQAFVREALIGMTFGLETSTTRRRPSYPRKRGALPGGESIALDVMDHTRVPIFGSPPEAWQSLKELLTTGVITSGAVVGDVANAPGEMILVAGGTVLIVRLLRPSFDRFSTGLADIVGDQVDYWREDLRRRRKGDS